MGFKDLFVTFALIGIFVLCMINFGIQIARDNDSTTSIMDNPQMNATFSGLETNLSTFQSQTSAQRDIFEGDNPKVGLGFFMLETIMGAGRVFTGMVFGVFSLLLGPLATIIGISPVIIGIIASILIVSIILAAWRAYKVGE